MKKLKQILIVATLLPLLSGATGCKNAFEEASSKTTDDAYEFQAEVYANRKEWTSAIATIGLMTPQGQAKRSTQVTLASYYAGRCGLDLLSLATQIADGISTTKLMPILLSAMKARTLTNLSDCVESESRLLAVGATPASRSPEENVLLAFVEFAKMGVALSSSNADANLDGALDAGFDPCSTSDIADTSVQELGTGLVIGATSLSASGSDAAADAVSAVATMCSAVDSYLGSSDFCDGTTASDFTGVKLLALRALIKSNELGFNTCNGTIGQNHAGTNEDCICPVVP